MSLNITCMLEVKNNLPAVKKSIDSYLAQTYTSKSLVIISKADKTNYNAIQSYLDTLDRSDIKLVFPKTKLDASFVESLKSDLITLWPDHILSHYQRLGIQINQLEKEKKKSCLFNDYLFFDWTNRRLFWVDKIFNDSLIIERKHFLKTYKAKFSWKENWLMLGQTKDVSRLSSEGYFIIEIPNGWGQCSKNSSVDIIPDKCKTEEFIHSKIHKIDREIGFFELAQPIMVNTLDEFQEIIAIV